MTLSCTTPCLYLHKSWYWLRIVLSSCNQELCAKSGERSCYTAGNEQKRQIADDCWCFHDKHCCRRLSDIMEYRTKNTAKPKLSSVDHITKKQHSDQAQYSAAKAIEQGRYISAKNRTKQYPCKEHHSRFLCFELIDSKNGNDIRKTELHSGYRCKTRYPQFNDEYYERDRCEHRHIGQPFRIHGITSPVHQYLSERHDLSQVCWEGRQSAHLLASSYSCRYGLDIPLPAF